jgi:hypothetical protein
MRRLFQVHTMANSPAEWSLLVCKVSLPEKQSRREFPHPDVLDRQRLTVSSPLVKQRSHRGVNCQSFSVYEKPQVSREQPLRASQNASMAANNVSMRPLSPEKSLEFGKHAMPTTHCRWSQGTESREGQIHTFRRRELRSVAEQDGGEALATFGQAAMCHGTG